MKSKKNFKKKPVNYRKDQDEVRIRERKKQPKKFNKHHFYTLLEEEDDLDTVNLYPDREDS